MCPSLASFGRYVCLFFFFSHIFYILTNNLYVFRFSLHYKAHGRFVWVAVAKSSPNDTLRRLVWALCTHFLCSLHVFYLLTNKFYHIQAWSMLWKYRDHSVGTDEKNKLKWCVLRCLGHMYVFFFSFFFFFLTNSIFYLGSNDVLRQCGGFGWAATTKTGPNDAICVIWAIDTHFYFYRALFILTYIFYLI